MLQEPALAAGPRDDRLGHVFSAFAMWFAETFATPARGGRASANCTRLIACVAVSCRRCSAGAAPCSLLRLQLRRHWNQAAAVRLRHSVSISGRVNKVSSSSLPGN